MTNKNSPNKGGQPPKVLNEYDIELIAGLAAGMTQKQIAEYFGMTEDTFLKVKKRQPEVLREYKKGKARAVAGATSVLLDLVRDKYFPAVAFYLKTQGGWRETGEIKTEEEEDNSRPTPLLVKFVGKPDKDNMKEVKEIKSE